MGAHVIMPVWWRPGAVLKQPTTIEDLLDRVVVCPSGCWIWAGGTSGRDGTGYGRILRPGTRNAMAAHKYVYQTFVGPVPRGYHVDHVCRQWAVYPMTSRLCVRPDHLEAVTASENMLRRSAAKRNGVALPPVTMAAALPHCSIEDELVAAFDGV